MVKRKKTILICPLDWGIGHASRCVPIIRYLNELQQKVVVAADGKPLAFLEQQFPALDFEKMKGHTPTYSAGNHQSIKLFTQLPMFISSFFADHRQTEALVQKVHANAVISDNRFGAFSKKVPSVYITHQLNIPLAKGFGGLSPVAGVIHRAIIQQYNSCWIPDFEGECSLSGKLSQARINKKKVGYLGPLSRFLDCAVNMIPKNNDVLFMLSGPEPQRTILEKKIIQQLEQTAIKATILRGLPNNKDLPATAPHITLLNHAKDEQILSLVARSQHIVARAGYSTIMDLTALGRSATLIPTPGQAEQEYLAGYLSKKGLFTQSSQKEFNLQSLLTLGQSQDFKAGVTNHLYKEIIDPWIAEI